MNEKIRVDRVELGVFDSGKVLNVCAREFICNAAGKVQGDVDAETAEVKGACKVTGNTKATLLKVSGSMKVLGNVRAELIRVKGAFKVEGDIDAPNLRIAGAAKVAGKIRSEGEIFVQGVLKCMSDIDSAKFRLLGVVEVDGTLRSKEFLAELGGKSAIHTLESEIIHVVSGDRIHHSELIVKRISGIDIYIENAVVGYLEGKKVRIGPGCTVSEVKSQDVEVHKSSKVGKRL
ncbi:MAG: polymer-forming cytoskeletal protein [Thermoplasmata archaeon]|nr:polymer-forming cytoskeletal protein [Thermoplasmata archaeon]